MSEFKSSLLDLQMDRAVRLLKRADQLEQDHELRLETFAKLVTNVFNIHEDIHNMTRCTDETLRRITRANDLLASSIRILKEVHGE